MSEAVDFDRDRGSEGPFDVGYRSDSVFDRGDVGARRDPTHDVGRAVVGVRLAEESCETGAGDRCAVREWLGTIEFGEHGASDDPVVVASVGAFAVHGVADPLAQLVEGRGSERDLVGTVRRAAGDDLGADRAAQGRESPRGHGAPVELHIDRVEFGQGRNSWCVEQRGLRIEDAGIVGDRGEVPRPAVAPGSGDEMIEARREHQDGHDPEDSEDRTEDGRADRHGGGSASRFEGHPHTGRRDRSQARSGGGARDRRDAPRHRVLGAALSRRSEGPEERDQQDSGDDRDRPEREHGPVDAQTGSGSARRATPIGNSGDAAAAPTTANKAPPRAIGTARNPLTAMR